MSNVGPKVVSRWNWLNRRPQRLQSGSMAEVLQDIQYCRQREQLASLKSHVKTWRARRAEAEEAFIDRFCEEVLSAHVGSSRA